MRLLCAEDCSQVLLHQNGNPIKEKKTKTEKITVGIQKQFSKTSVWLCMSGNIQDKKMYNSVTSETLSRIDHRFFVD
jgi:hypothetical protein